MAVSIRFKELWNKLDDAEKCKLIKEQAKTINQLHIKMTKASMVEFEYTGSRTGIRGGKATTVTANAQKATALYLSSVEDLKYMVTSL